MNNIITADGEIIAPLTETERERLTEYEEQVERGFVALFHIREEGLWREYGTFESYFAQRWNGDNRRRRNQILAGFRVFVVLQSSFAGTGVPISEAEYTLRPLVSLADKNPEQAVEVYRSALELSDGDTPSHREITLAKKLTLTPEEIKREEAAIQIDGMKRYGDLLAELRSGGDPAKLLGLVVALEGCDDTVRKVLRRLDIRDLALIRALNDGYCKGSETAVEVIRTQALNFGEYVVRLENATMRDYRRLLDLGYQEHRLRAQALKRGEAVSVVVFRNDIEGTLYSLKEVLPYSELIALANAIGEM